MKAEAAISFWNHKSIEQKREPNHRNRLTKVLSQSRICENEEFKIALYVPFSLLNVKKNAFFNFMGSCIAVAGGMLTFLK